MEAEEFNYNLSKRNDLYIQHKAIALLWFAAIKNQDGMTLIELCNILSAELNYNPNITRIRADLQGSIFVALLNGEYRIKKAALHDVQKEFNLDFESDELPEPKTKGALIPSDFYKGAPSPIRKIFVELNGCYESKYWNASAILLRRLAETLSIQAFYSKGREKLILNRRGETLPFGLIVGVHTDKKPFRLRKESLKALAHILAMGNLGAHGEYNNVVRSIIDEHKLGYSVLFQHLINLSGDST